MEVLKFGGSSVSSKISLENMLKIVDGYKLDESPLVIVVSALKGITNRLVKLTELLREKDDEYIQELKKISQHHTDFMNLIFDEIPQKLTKKIKVLENDLIENVRSILLKGDLSKKEYDKIVSYGELFSANIVTSYLKSNSLDFYFKDSRDLIITDSTFTNAKVNWHLTDLVTKSFFARNKNSYVITGFVARSIYGDTTTLGRGGSDYTATILGTVLKAEKVTKWTDVNGIMTADPNKVLKASTLESITFSELRNLSKFGSNVLVHPSSINELSKHNIPFLIRNTFDHNFKGTQVINKNTSSKKALSLHETCSLVGFKKGSDIPKRLIKEIIDKNYLFFRIKRPKNKEKAYYVVSEECLNFFSLNTNQSDKKLTLLPDFKDVDIIDKDMILITITGQNMEKNHELEKIKKVLEKEQIEILGFRLFYNSISLILNQEDFKKALVLIHEEVTKIEEIHTMLN